MLTTFRNLGVTPDFLIYHRYEQAPGGENDALLLMAPENGASQAGQGWAADAAGLRTQLNNYLGTAVAAHIELDITEDNSVYTNPGKQSTSLVNGLYLADSVANVLQTEFNALVWWDLRNGEDNTQNNSSSLYGWRLYGDYGILATPAGQPWGDPSYFDGYPAYYTMKLMSHFARGGDAVVHAASDNTLLPVYAALRADGSLSLLVINKSSTATSTANVSITGFVPLATAGIAVYSYGIPQDTAAQTGTGSPDIATSMIATPQFVVNGGTRSITTTASFGPYSATVLSFQPAPLSGPVISTQPVNQTPTSGQSVVFSVTASSNPLPTYQWQVEARGTGTWTNLSDNSTYSGSGTASLTVNSSALLDGNSFQCMITNSIGTVTTTPVTLVVETPLAVATLAGQAGTSGHADGTRSGAQFNSPTDIAVDGSGNIYAADTDNDTVRKITPDGVATTIAGQSGVSGSNDGTGSALFNHPAGIAVDGSGNAYVADTTNNTIRKLVIASGTVSTLAGQAGVTGSTNGTGTAARFNGPSGIIADATGNLYVADTLNHTVRKVTGAGVVTTIAGTAGTSGFTDATSTAARFHGPQGLALDTLGNLFVADTNNNAIRMIATANGVVSTVAGQAGIAGSIDGAVSQAQFHFPSGVAVDAGGNLYIADTDNHILRKIAPSSPSVGSNAISLATGKVSTLAGQAGSSGSVDGIGAAARLNFPTGVAVYASLSAQAVPVAGSSSVVYIADTTNSTIRLAVVPAAPAIMSQPQSLTVTVGDTATLTVLAAGSPAPTYQWLFNGSAISGATSSTLALSNAQFANGGNYTVTIRNIVGTVTSNQATLTVNPASTPPSGGGSSSGGGGGGGGAPSVWFCGMLSLLALARRMFRRK